jgi:hypothetical protein
MFPEDAFDHDAGMCALGIFGISNAFGASDSGATAPVSVGMVNAGVDGAGACGRVAKGLVFAGG